MTKLYSVAGITMDKNDNATVKFTNNLKSRSLALKREGYKIIDFIELPHPMTSQEAALYLKTHDQMNNDFFQKVIDEYLNKPTQTRPPRISQKQENEIIESEEMLEYDTPIFDSIMDYDILDSEIDYDIQSDELEEFEQYIHRDEVEEYE